MVVKRHQNVTGSQFSKERIQSQERKLQEKVYLESPRVRKGEPAGLCGLRKPVTEAKEGPLELRRKKGKGKMPRGGRAHLRRGWRKVRVCERENATSAL